jgi:6-phosphogluconolactonase
MPSAKKALFSLRQIADLIGTFLDTLFRILFRLRFDMIEKMEFVAMEETGKGKVVKPEIRIAETMEDLTRMVAGEFLQRAVEAVNQKKFFTVTLSGGSTPGCLYNMLAEPKGLFITRVPWKNCHFFWGDERHVPPDHPQSNYRMAHETLLSRVPVPRENVHRVPAENPDAGETADLYEAEIREFFHLRDNEWPRFDIVLLGLGVDGHTASLFPGASILREGKRRVSAEWIEKLESYRISMTPPVLNHAACVAFLVSGVEKADAVREAIQGKYQPEKYPAQLIRPEHGKLLWFLDRTASDQLIR